MRESTPELRALLASQQFVKCNLFTFTLISGLVYRWTDAGVDVVANGQIFSGDGPSISGVRYALVCGLQVDTLDLQVMFKDGDTIGGAEWPVAVRSGALDGATMLVEKAFLPAWGQPAQTLQVFEGEVQGAECVDLEVRLPVKSDADKLNITVPRLAFQPGCMRTLYDTGCGVNPAGYMASSGVTGVPNRYSFFTGLSQPDGYFSLGTVIFTSGKNAGVRRAIKVYSHLQGRIELSYPLSVELAIGDTFVVRAGCDKTQGPNGCAKFNNIINFKAVPYTPKPEAIL